MKLALWILVALVASTWRCTLVNCIDRTSNVEQLLRLSTDYAPPRFVKAVSKVITGNPDKRHISTSYIERQNLTLRMMSRRFTRPTNAFSKKLSHLKAAITLHFAYYNFCRILQSLKRTPSMAPGLRITFGLSRNL